MGGIVSDSVRTDEIVDGTAELDRALVFDQAPVACLLLDLDLTIVAATDRYLEATMTTRPGIIGRNLFEAFPDNPDDLGATGTSNLAASLERVVRTKHADSMAVQKYDVRRPDDEGGHFETRHWSPVNSPVLTVDGELVGVIHRVEDVTELMDLRASVTSRNEEIELTPLEEELSRRREQDLANARLMEVDRVRREFISQMSHELRTPLNAVVGFGQLLEMGDLDPRQQKAVHQILRSSRHLLGLIDDVLDFAEIEAGSMNTSIEPVIVGELIAQALEMIGPTAAHRGTSSSSSRSPSANVAVAADRQRALQVLLNLLSNAVKYTHTGGTVEIAVTVGRSRVQVVVADDGPGISPDLQGRLFAPFDRLGMELTDIEGTGVGLALARSLAQRMGGSVESPAAGAAARSSCSSSPVGRRPARPRRPHARSASGGGDGEQPAGVGALRRGQPGQPPPRRGGRRDHARRRSDDRGPREASASTWPSRTSPTSSCSTCTSPTSTGRRCSHACDPIPAPSGFGSCSSRPTPRGIASSGCGPRTPAT